MSSWRALQQELDAWSASGRRATLWWRDDDARADSPALRRLLGISRAHDVPLAIAVIPAALDPRLAEALGPAATATVVQHGYAHHNHAPPGERSCELGAHRPLAACLEELEHGREALARSFGERFEPVLVPPWNRIDGTVVAALPSASFEGLSTFGPRSDGLAAPGLVQFNAHVDVIAWRRDRRFIGPEAAVERLLQHLRARREQSVDADEATGVLTHHLDLGGDAWSFLDELMARTREHAAAAWLDARALLSGARRALTSSRSA